MTKQKKHTYFFEYCSTFSRLVIGLLLVLHVFFTSYRDPFFSSPDYWLLHTFAVSEVLASQEETEVELHQPEIPDMIDQFGMHVLSIHELSLATLVLDQLHGTTFEASDSQNAIDTIDILDAKDILDIQTPPNQKNWRYLTIPFTLADLDNRSGWQDFFDQAKQYRIIPIVRLTTAFSDQSWQQPTRKNIVDQISFLNTLRWPTSKKHIIIFNEVNHAAEWGGEIDPEMYAEYLVFAAKWAKTEGSDFVVLPAAMDLAAPNGPTTMEAFTYLDRMLQFDATVFDHIDIWNSHSYPNPGFSASAYRTGQNSLRGFLYELSFLKDRTGKELPVIITETGWDLKAARQPNLKAYYQYAFDNIWSDHRVLGITPFILKGDPGPFSGFSFVDASDAPTPQFFAVQHALKNRL